MSNEYYNQKELHYRDHNIYISRWKDEEGDVVTSFAAFDATGKQIADGWYGWKLTDQEVKTEFDVVLADRTEHPEYYE